MKKIKLLFALLIFCALFFFSCACFFVLRGEINWFHTLLSAKIVLIFLIILVLFILSSNYILNMFEAKLIRSSKDLKRYIKDKIFLNSETAHYVAPLDELKAFEISINKLINKITYSIVELNEKSEGIQNILSSMEQGFIMLDENFCVLLINNKGLEFLNLPENTINDKITAYYRNTIFVDSLNEVKKTKKYISIDIIKEKLVLRFSIAPVANKGFVVLISDVSEIVRLEKIRSDFVANVSHELKTPLTSITGFSELIASGLVKDPEKMIIFNEKINKESKRLIRLVEDLLTLSYVENTKKGEEDYQTEMVDINGIFSYVFDVCSFQMKDKNIKHSIFGELSIFANSDHMHTLILNLVENAVKYNRQNGNIFVHLFSDESGKGFTVADTGIGISQPDVDRIFERFYRVDKARSRATGGTGLGLSISKHIVSLYNGEISVTSSESGTSFRVCFPKGL